MIHSLFIAQDVTHRT